jgi:putative (di)nucleoside polyphosphate hydrolase
VPGSCCAIQTDWSLLANGSIAPARRGRCRKAALIRGKTRWNLPFANWGEEAGIAPHHVDLVARSAGEHLYDLPDDMIGKIWGGKYRGQSQHWFLMAFLGSDADINIETEHPEFRAWRWAHPSELVDLIVPFKRELYANVLQEFADHL